MGELFHLVTPGELAGATSGGHYRPASLEAEGFVHLSEAAQLSDTIARHFAGVVDLVVLRLDESALGDVRHEDLYGHGVFPHLYGPVPLDAVLAVETVDAYR
jgi:uncharacterized protein (DUF952 family)